MFGLGFGMYTKFLMGFQPSGWHVLRLAICLCLCGNVGAALYVIAVVCSTWSAVNLHTSQRDVLTPYGDSRVTSVRAGNRMVTRLVN